MNVGEPNSAVMHFKTLQDAFYFFIDMTDACLQAADKTGVPLTAEGYDVQSGRHS